MKFEDKKYKDDLVKEFKSKLAELKQEFDKAEKEQKPQNPDKEQE